MEVTRAAEAPRYEAPGHHGMAMVRLQGREASRAEAMWVGLSHVLPGGGTTLSASPQEKIYIVVAGELTVRTETSEATLGPLDSCVIPPGEARALENRSPLPASVILVMQER